METENWREKERIKKRERLSQTNSNQNSNAFFNCRRLKGLVTVLSFTCPLKYKRNSTYCHQWSLLFWVNDYFCNATELPVHEHSSNDGENTTNNTTTNDNNNNKAWNNEIRLKKFLSIIHHKMHDTSFCSKVIEFSLHYPKYILCLKLSRVQSLLRSFYSLSWLLETGINEVYKTSVLL